MESYSRFQYQAAFMLADQVYTEKASRKEAQEALVAEHGINPATASIFLECYKRMREGRAYKRALSFDATRVFLEGIETQGGLEALALAIQAADAHVLYRQAAAINSTSLRRLIEEFRARLAETVVPMPGEHLTPFLKEGERMTVYVSRIERSAVARKRCLDHHGTKCCICGFCFEEFWGELGVGFIHVHHLDPMANTDGVRDVDPVKDLVPLCPNCHAMAHRKNPPLEIDELKARRKRG